MCPKPKQLNKELPPAEKGAEPTEIGAKRQAEDDAIFGGTPDLRVKRPGKSGMNTKPIAGASGASGGMQIT